MTVATSRRHRWVRAAAAVSLLLILGGASTAHQVELVQEAWFPEPEGGEWVRVPAGFYRLGRGGEDVLMLAPVKGGDSYRLAADAVDREEPLEGPLAEALLAEGGSTHLLLLGQDGKGLASLGSAQPVAERTVARRSQHGVCPRGFEIQIGQLRETPIASCVRRRSVFQGIGPVTCPPGTQPTNLEARDGSDLCRAPDGRMLPAVCRTRGARPVPRAGAPDECGLTAFRVEHADMRLVER
jgi:hypothetical protein